ncbi:hypothetical protein QOZ80_1BG0055850 [Eleusine coracana subsp. coracana]|nr:hypothetical protein QOZ80_1BG0055850 [Eleusine coracana subsp. coracana]
MWTGWEKKKTACVSGGSGYIASALIKMLLEKGYAVKTTVRNPDDTEKTSHLKDLQAVGALTILRADLVEEGSFDEAVAGCDVVFLVAAPVNIAAEDQEKEMIEPAVRGTLNVLRSCAKAGTYVTAEKPQAWGYVVAKVLSEKEAFRFAQEKGISLVSLFPGLTVGASPAPKAKTSVPCALSLLSGDDAALDALKGLETSHGCVPVVGLDDLCRAHVFVAETEAASGRYLCCGFNTTVVEMARVLAEKYPQYINVRKKNTDGFGDLLDKPRLCLSSVKLAREGFEFKVKTLDDMYDDGLVDEWNKRNMKAATAAIFAAAFILCALHAEPVQARSRSRHGHRHRHRSTPSPPAPLAGQGMGSGSMSPSGDQFLPPPQWMYYYTSGSPFGEVLPPPLKRRSMLGLRS